MSDVPMSPPKDHLYAGVPLRVKLISLSGLLLAMLLAALDQTIVATAMPRVVADLGGFDRFSWVFTSFMLASTTCIPIAGKLSDLFGRKWVLLGATAIFIAGSMLCGTSQNMTQLILWRGVQGVGAAGIIGNAFAALADLFAPADRAKWQGLFGAVYGLASVVGPLLGGYITDNWTWRWVFYINLPVGFLALAVVLFGMPGLKQREGSWSIDFAGAVVLIGGIASLLLALTWGGSVYAWGSPQVLGLLGAAALCLVAFLVIERRASEPIVPLWLFRNSVFAVSMGALFLTGFAMFGAIIYIPLFMQGVIGVSATDSGAVVMPMSLGMVTASMIASQIIARTGHYKYIALGGMLLVALGMLLLSRMDETTSNLTAVRNMVLVGAGIGVNFPTFFVAVQNNVEMRVIGIASALVQFFRSIGGTVGVAVLGAFMSASLHAALAGHLPPTLPRDVRDAMTDPQLLVSNGQRAAMEQQLADVPGGVEAFRQGIEVLRGALTGAIQDVFLVGVFVGLAAAVMVLFLKQRSTHGRARGSREPSTRSVQAASSGSGT